MLIVTPTTTITSLQLKVIRFGLLRDIKAKNLGRSNKMTKVNGGKIIPNTGESFQLAKDVTGEVSRRACLKVINDLLGY